MLGVGGIFVVSEIKLGEEVSIASVGRGRFFF